MGLFGRARRLTMALAGDRPWTTPSGGVLRCDEVRLGEGPIVSLPGIDVADLSEHDAWARLTVLEPGPPQPVWVHEGSEIAIGAEIWRVERIVDTGRRLGVAPPGMVGGAFPRRMPTTVVTLTRER